MHSIQLVEQPPFNGQVVGANPAVGVAVETPIAIVADMATLGGLATDQDTPYTAQAVEKLWTILKSPQMAGTVKNFASAG